MAAGTFDYGAFTYACRGGSIVSARVVSFPAVSGSYIRFRALSEMGGNPWTSVAELNVINAAGKAVIPTGLMLAPSTILGGNTVQGTVILNSAAPSGGTIVSLSSTNTAIATVPSTVTVAAGQTSATFSVSTVSGAYGSPSISATANGTTVSSKLTVQSPIAKSGWALKYVDSQESTAENGLATNSFDGNASTKWHTQYSSGDAPLPHTIQIDLGTSYTVSGFTYLPRQDGCSNGTISQYEFYVSADGVTWGSAIANGTFNYGTANLTCGGGTILPAQQINFTPVSARYVCLRALTEVNGNPWTAVAEINVLH